MEESDVRIKEISRHRTSSSSTEITEEQVHAAIERVLCINWKEKNDHSVFVPETSESFKEAPITSDNLISQAIMEVLSQIATGNNPLKNLVINTESDNASLNSVTLSPSQSPVVSPVNCPNTSVAICASSNSPQSLAINYLTESYSRVAVEERNHPKKSSIPPLSEVLADLRAQLVSRITYKLIK